MPIDPKVVDVAQQSDIGPFWWRGEWLTNNGLDVKRCGSWLSARDEALRLNAEERARRVLLAQAECVSDGAANAAREAYLSHEGSDDVEAMRAAIAAALRFEAGE
jgi:hypothetical protein